MSDWAATVIDKSRDFTIRPDGQARLSIVPKVTFTDGAITFTESPSFQVDVTDTQIAEYCRARIKGALEVSDVAFAALTLGPVTLPPDPVSDPKQQDDLRAAQVALNVAARDAQIKALGDPDATAALAALKAAEAAVKG